MKKHIYSIIGIGFLSLTFSGCSEDFLTTSPYATPTDEVYFQTYIQLDEALIGAYKAVADRTFKEDPEYGWWLLGNVGSDDAERGASLSNDPNQDDICYSRQDPSNGAVASIWASWYKVLARCNLVIDKSEVVTGDKDIIERIVREAKFLRALSYYHLVINWGEVPLFTSYAYASEAIRPKSPVEEIWQLIEDDLTEATGLPSRSEWGTAQLGRATSGAAWSILGKVFMYQHKYAEAANAFSEVVSSNEYSLVDDYGLIFRQEGNNNSESIFETQHMAYTNASTGSINPMMQQPSEEPSAGWSRNTPTQDLLDEFEEGDPRIIYTFLFVGDTLPSNSATPYVVKNIESNTGYASRKAYLPIPERGNQDKFDYAQNIKFLRYAEVLLLYAEALNETGNPGEALIYMNMIRERARNTPSSDPDRIYCNFDLSYTGELLPDIITMDQAELRDAIYHEMRVELGEEGHRREFLMRTGQFFERMNAVKELNLSDEKWLLLPIPRDEIAKSDGVLIQNQGY